MSSHVQCHVCHGDHRAELHRVIRRVRTWWYRTEVSPEPYVAEVKQQRAAILPERKYATGSKGTGEALGA